MVHQFRAQEPLSAVRLYIEMNRTDGSRDAFDLMTAFPKKIFTRDEMEMPLKSLGMFAIHTCTYIYKDISFCEQMPTWLLSHFQPNVDKVIGGKYALISATLTNARVARDK